MYEFLLTCKIFSILFARVGTFTTTRWWMRTLWHWWAWVQSAVRVTAMRWAGPCSAFDRHRGASQTTRANKVCEFDWVILNLNRHFKLNEEDWMPLQAVLILILGVLFAYLSALSKAEKFVYIENQLFISSSHQWRNGANNMNFANRIAGTIGVRIGSILF